MAQQMLTRCLKLLSDLEGFGSDQFFAEGWVAAARRS